jgi:proteasome lid subunit RPN8/RPN11
VNLPAPLADEILTHTRAGLPNEACGLLAGDSSGVHAVYPTVNADPSPVSYTIDPAGHFAALQDAERRGLELIGAFHSHVDGPPYPSPRDVAGAAEPDWIWLVIGPMRGVAELRAYRIQDGRVTEEELVIRDR